METRPMPEPEKTYHMYDAIVAQPEAFRAVAARNAVAAVRWAPAVVGARRLWLVGTGSSHHAARFGAYGLRHHMEHLDVQTVAAFDFSLYGPPLSPDDVVVVVTHRGTKLYSRQALERARAAGCTTVLITGQGGDRDAPADGIFITVPQEQSAAHTVSLTGSVAVLWALAVASGMEARRTGARRSDGEWAGEVAAAVEKSAETVARALREALGTESAVRSLAPLCLNARRIWLAGGGPGAVAAEETALKIKETSYLQAEGMPVETLIHGPFQCVESEDVFVLVAQDGPSRSRMDQFRRMVHEVGAPAIVVTDGDADRDIAYPGERWIRVPRVPEPLSGLVSLVPLQLLSYHLALMKGTDPDGFRQEDARFAAAKNAVPL